MARRMGGGLAGEALAPMQKRDQKLDMAEMSNVPGPGGGRLRFHQIGDFIRHS